MNVARRSKDLKALLDIRIGPGAATFPNDVRRVHLEFAFKFNDGHFGARKLWRSYLPRLKYYNPAVSMTVNRHKDQAGHSTLTVFFANSARSSSPTTSHSPTSSTDTSRKPSDHDGWDRTEIIDMKHKHETEILKRLVEVTNAVPYELSAEDKSELEKVAEERKRRDKHSERQGRINEKRKHEEALLKQARESAT